MLRLFKGGPIIWGPDKFLRKMREEGLDTSLVQLPFLDNNSSTVRTWFEDSYGNNFVDPRGDFVNPRGYLVGTYCVEECVVVGKGGLKSKGVERYGFEIPIRDAEPKETIPIRDMGYRETRKAA
jgi:hypothetical protein